MLAATATAAVSSIANSNKLSARDYGPGTQQTATIRISLF